MELRHLRYFVAVAEELNFTRAAEKLHLAQPSLTRQIHNLEEELGVRLLNRAKNQVSLTEEGRSFLIDARRLVAQSLESVQAVQRLSRGTAWTLSRLCATNRLASIKKLRPSSVSETWFLARFSRRTPSSSSKL